MAIGPEPRRVRTIVTGQYGLATLGPEPGPAGSGVGGPSGAGEPTLAGGLLPKLFGSLGISIGGVPGVPAIGVPEAYAPAPPPDAGAAEPLDVRTRIVSRRLGGPGLFAPGLQHAGAPNFDFIRPRSFPRPAESHGSPHAGAAQPPPARTTVGARSPHPAGTTSPPADRADATTSNAEFTIPSWL
jgi:hypothetical protein